MALIQADKRYIGCCRFIKRTTFLFARIPCLDLDRLIARLDEQPDVWEQEQYAEVSINRASRGYYLVILIFAMVAIKNLTVPVMIFALVNHNNPDSDLISRPEEGYHQLACLATNCTRLSSPMEQQTLGKDLMRLPLASLCKPTYSSFFGPLIDLDVRGSYMMLVFGSCCLLFCVAFPLRQLSKRSTNEPMMFLVAPKLTNNLHVLRRIDQLFEELKVSISSFEIKEGSKITKNRCIRLVSSTLPRVDELYGETAKDSYLSSCLPSVRTEWWRARISIVFVKLVVLTYVNQIIPNSCIFFHYSGLILDRNALFERYKLEMLQTNCSIWLADDAIAKTPIELQPRSQLYQNAYSMIDAIIYLAIGQLILLAVFVYFLLTCYELSCWNHELEHLLRFALEMLRMNHLLPVQGEDSNIDLKNASSIIMDLRNRFRSKVKQNFQLLFDFAQQSNELDIDQSFGSFSKSLLRNLEDQQLIVRYIKDGKLNVNSQAIILEQIYVNLRLFIDQMKLYSPQVRNVILFTYCLNYGMVLGAVIYNKMIKDLILEPLVMLLLCWFCANLTTLLIASYHAQSNKLLAYVWSILATEAAQKGEKNFRLKHAKSIWFRLVVAIDCNGGFSMTTVGTRITYVNVIQLIIWTATLLLFAFGPLSYA